MMEAECSSTTKADLDINHLKTIQMELEETTPMERMILWIESGCATQGERWEEYKALMLKSEQMFAKYAANQEIINYLNSKNN